MSKRRKSLATTKGKDTSNRAKPLVAGAGYMGGSSRGMRRSMRGTIISTPINCDYTVQLCKYEGYKYIGKKMLGTYNLNENNSYTVELGEVSVD